MIELNKKQIELLFNNNFKFIKNNNPIFGVSSIELINQDDKSLKKGRLGYIKIINKSFSTEAVINVTDTEDLMKFNKFIIELNNDNFNDFIKFINEKVYLHLYNNPCEFNLKYLGLEIEVHSCFNTLPETRNFIKKIIECFKTIKNNHPELDYIEDINEKESFCAILTKYTDIKFYSDDPWIYFVPPINPNSKFQSIAKQNENTLAIPIETNDEFLKEFTEYVEDLIKKEK